MKHTIILSVLILGLFYDSQQVRTKQLFEMVNSEAANSKTNQGRINSIFSSIQDDRKKVEVNMIQKNENAKTESLFDNNEKIQPINKSLFNDNKPTTNNVNKFLNKNIKAEKGKSLFNFQEDKVAGNFVFNLNKATGNNLNNIQNDNITQGNKSLFNRDIETIKPNIKLNESIFKPLNEITNNNSKDSGDNDLKSNAVGNINSLSKILNKPQKYPQKSSNSIFNQSHHNHSDNKEEHHTEDKLNHNKKQKNSKDKSERNNNQNNSGRNYEAKSDAKINNLKVDDAELINKKNEIEKLKSKVLNLMNINKEILTQIEKKKKLKKKTLDLSGELINLIETCQAPIAEFENKLQATAQKASQKLGAKESELKKTYGDVRTNLDNLLEKVGIAKSSINEISNDESFLTGELKKNYVTKKLSVLNNVEVEGKANVHTIQTDSIDIGNIKLDLEKIYISNTNTEIILGAEILSIKELIENLELIEKLRVRCGEDLSSCIQYDNLHFQADMQKQNQIVQQLKVLRHKAKEIINKGY